MGLFGLGSKRKLPSQPMALPPDLHGHGIPTAPPGAHPPADVEVSELTLDDDEFSSTFGLATTQFADTVPVPIDTDDDPWASRLRLD